MTARLALLALIALVAGCGGGADPPAETVQTPPPQSSATPGEQTSAPPAQGSAANAFIGSIAVDPSDGTVMRLEKGGSTLLLNGSRQVDDGPGEYPDIYRVFVDLIDARASLVDIAPFRLVADCLLIGRTTRADPIHM